MARGRGAGTETKKITGGRGKKGAARDAAMKIGVESGGGVRRHQDDWLRTGLAQEAVGWGCLSAALITLSVGLLPPHHQLHLSVSSAPRGVAGDGT